MQRKLSIGRTVGAQFLYEIGDSNHNEHCTASLSGQTPTRQVSANAGRFSCTPSPSHSQYAGGDPDTFNPGSNAPLRHSPGPPKGLVDIADLTLCVTVHPSCAYALLITGTRSFHQPAPTAQSSARQTPTLDELSKRTWRRPRRPRPKSRFQRVLEHVHVQGGSCRVHRRHTVGPETSESPAALALAPFDSLNTSTTETAPGPRPVEYRVSPCLTASCKVLEERRSGPRKTSRCGCLPAVARHLVRIACFEHGARYQGRRICALRSFGHGFPRWKTQTRCG